MLLAEFVRSLEEDSYFDPGIREHLKNRGYKFLGQGVDQMAFREPDTGQVLKIFGAGAQGQKMFKIWAGYCQDRPGNPFLPKFYDYESFQFRGKNYFQIKQEPLAENSAMALPVSRLALYIDMMPRLVTDPDQVPVLMLDPEQRDRYFRPLLGARYLRSLNQALANLEYLPRRQLALLIATLCEIVARGKDFGWQNDLHVGNIMFRGKTPVIMDPWVAWPPRSWVAF